MNFLKISLLLLLISSCGTYENRRTDWQNQPYTDPPPPSAIDPAIQVIINLFNTDAIRYGADLSNLVRLRVAIFKDEEFKNRAVGRCYTYQDSRGKLLYSEIYVTSGWNLKSYLFKGLIYHELGHCVLLLDHSSGVEIMSSTLHSEAFYKTNWENLVKNLFTKPK